MFETKNKMLLSSVKFIKIFFLSLDVVGYALFGRGSYTYHSRGVYTVTVTAKNAVDELVITKEVSIGKCLNLTFSLI